MKKQYTQFTQTLANEKSYEQNLNTTLNCRRLLRTLDLVYCLFIFLKFSCNKMSCRFGWFAFCFINISSSSFMILQVKLLFLILLEPCHLLELLRFRADYFLFFSFITLVYFSRETIALLHKNFLPFLPSMTLSKGTDF